MAKVTVEAEVVDEHNDLVDALRKVLLASIGGVALAQDEIGKFLNRMVERGEIAEKDARKLMDEAFTRVTVPMAWQCWWNV